MNRHVNGGFASADEKSDFYGRFGIMVRRRPLGHQEVLDAVGRVTARDRRLVPLLAGARVLTTDQISEVFFDNATTARHRLKVLFDLRVLDRFQPPLHKGSAPYHWVLDQLGALIVDVDRDRDPPKRFKRDRRMALAQSSHLAHRVGANGFFTALYAAARRLPDAELVCWLPEARCAPWSKHLVIPHGYGVWRQDGRAVEFYLEYDRHTETRARLAAKLDRYAELNETTGRNTPVLFCFATARREASVRRALAGSPVPPATAALTPTRRPHETIWTPVGDGLAGAAPVPLALLGSAP